MIAPIALSKLKLSTQVCRDPSNTRMVGQLGAIELLVGLLRQALDVATTSGPDALRHPVVCLALETLALLTAETGPHKDALRRAGGVPALVAMLDAPLHLHYRAVLAVRIFTEREIDRQAVLLCGGLPKLVALMGEHSKAETRQGKHCPPLYLSCFAIVQWCGGGFLRGKEGGRRRLSRIWACRWNKQHAIPLT